MISAAITKMKWILSKYCEPVFSTLLHFKQRLTGVNLSFFLTNYDEYFQQQWGKLHVDMVEAWREVGDAEEAQIDSLNPAHPVSSSSSHSRICESFRR